MKRQLSDHLKLLLEPVIWPQPEAAWRPAADVYRCEHGWLVKFDLAGVREPDIEIHVQGSQIIVSGRRRDSRVYQRQEAHLMEIAYSQFKRSVELPEEIDKAELRTEYRDGMLLVHVLSKQEGDQ